MPDRAAAVPAECSRQIRETVGVNTSKIFDACLDKDCVDELRVYPTESSPTRLENALNVRPRSADLLYVDVSVSPISFNRGYYTVDCTYFYRVSGETFPAGQAAQHEEDQQLDVQHFVDKSISIHVSTPFR